jgi:hypothetical protein
MVPGNARPCIADHPASGRPIANREPRDKAAFLSSKEEQYGIALVVGGRNIPAYIYAGSLSETERGEREERRKIFNCTPKCRVPRESAREKMQEGGRAEEGVRGGREGGREGGKDRGKEV